MSEPLKFYGKALSSQLRRHDLQQRERGDQTVVHAPHGDRGEFADALYQLGAVERRHLMAQGDAVTAQPGGSFRERNGRRSSRLLSR